MTDRLLTDEEINEARALHIGLPLKCWPQHRAIAATQDTKTDRLSREDERRKMVEWLEGPCDNRDHNGFQVAALRVYCPDCMNELCEALREGRAPWA